MNSDRLTTSSIILLVAGIFCQITGYLLYGIPRSPDELLTTSEVIGAFIIFCFWMLSLLAWGSVISHLLKFSSSNSLVKMLLGSAFGVLVMGIFGALGLIGPNHENLAIVILVSGLVVNLILFGKKGHFSLKALRPKMEPEKYEAWVMCALGVVFILHLVNSFRVTSFWDPLWYNLTAPRLWSDAGKIFFDPKQLAAVQAASWEYLFLWGDTLLTGPKGGGLIVGQLFGQWTHLFLGFGGAALACYFFLLNFSTSRKWILLAILAMVASFPLSYVTTLAKNDWGIAFWVLGAFSILFVQGQSQLQQYVLVGFLLGLALSGKITSLFSIAPLFLLWIYFWRETATKKLIVQCSLILGGILLGGSLIWVRNFEFTGNPFFPSLNHLFHSTYLGPTWEKSEILYEGHFLHFEFWGTFLREMSQGGKLIWPFFLFPLIGWAMSKEKSLIFLGGTLFLSLFIFLAKVGPYSETRILGSTALLMAALAVFALRDLWGDGCYLFILFGVLALGFIPWDSPYRLSREPNPSLQIRQHVGGGSLAWLRDNIKDGEFTISLADTRLYYGSYLNLNRIWDYGDLDRAMLATPDSALELTKTLRKFGYKYLMNTNQPIDYFYDAHICQVLMTAIDKSRDQVVAFDNKSSYVVDLIKLENSLSSY